MIPTTLTTESTASVQRTDDGLTQPLENVATIEHANAPVEELEDEDGWVVLQATGSADQWIKCETPVSTEAAR